jgi:conjugal transfer pilus assembly protein TraW
MKALLAILCVAASLAPRLVHALDLGVIGPTYDIREPHLLAEIERRLLEKERSGELARLMDEARTRGINAVRSPAPVDGVGVTSKARTFYIDPSFTLDRNIVDAQGRLLFAAGTRKNPLDVVSLSKRLIFFDGRDTRQVARARQVISLHGGLVKPILTGGSYLDLMKAWRTPIFYDQGGALSRRLGIRQVPAVVSQEGSRLRVDEVTVE